MLAGPNQRKFAALHADGNVARTVQGKFGEGRRRRCGSQYELLDRGALASAPSHSLPVEVGQAVDTLALAWARLKRAGSNSPRTCESAQVRISSYSSLDGSARISLSRW